MNQRFRGFGIERDSTLASLQVLRKHNLPLINSLNPPPATTPGIGGGIAYDISTRKPYFSDGNGWLPVGAGASGTVESYSFIKSAGVQIISPDTPTVLTGWDDTASDTYHSLLGWDLDTGVYTAFQDEVLTLNVNVVWLGGISNLGVRTLRIEYTRVGIPGWTTIKEVSGPAVPDVNSDTPMSCSIHALIAQGDGIRVVVEQGSPVDINIAGGVLTSLSGFRVNSY